MGPQPSIHTLSPALQDDTNCSGPAFVYERIDPASSVVTFGFCVLNSKNNSRDHNFNVAIDDRMTLEDLNGSERLLVITHADGK